jgi:hypothetical protein
MPSLTKDEVISLFNIVPEINYHRFVETGTYLGETTSEMSNIFKKLDTIEIDEKLVIRAKKLYGHLPINFHLGDSVEVFKTLLPNINENSVFWLDGHWSSGYDAGKGPKDCPLIEELELIMNEFKNEALVIIDDCRLFGTKIVEDWQEITSEKIFRVVDSRLGKFFWFPSNLNPKDRLALWIKKV